MATKAKSPKATKAEVVVAAPAVLATPFSGLVQEPTTAPAVVTPHEAMLAKAAAANYMATVGGQQVAAAANVAARAASLNKPLAVQVANATYIIGRVPSLRAEYCRANWPAVEAALAEGEATGAQIQQAGATADFVKYAIKSGWLVAA